MVICEQWVEKCMELVVVASLCVLSWNLREGTDKRASFSQLG